MVSRLRLLVLCKILRLLLGLVCCFSQRMMLQLVCDVFPKHASQLIILRGLQSFMAVRLRKSAWDILKST